MQTTSNSHIEPSDPSDIVAGFIAPEIFEDGFGACDDFHCRFADKIWQDYLDGFAEGRVLVLRVSPHELQVALTAIRYEFEHSDLQFRYDEHKQRLFVRRKCDNEPATDKSKQRQCAAHGRIEIDSDCQCSSPRPDNDATKNASHPCDELARDFERIKQAWPTSSQASLLSSPPAHNVGSTYVPKLCFHDVDDIPIRSYDECWDRIDWSEARANVRVGKAVSCHVGIHQLEAAKHIFIDRLRYDYDEDDSWSDMDWRYDLSTSTLWVWRAGRSPWSASRGDVIASGNDRIADKDDPQPAGSAQRCHTGACAKSG